MTTTRPASTNTATTGRAKVPQEYSTVPNGTTAWGKMAWGESSGIPNGTGDNNAGQTAGQLTDVGDDIHYDNNNAHQETWAGDGAR